jgi:hypothetical protein
VVITIDAKTVYVAASGNNTTGDSWTNALTSIPNSSSSAVASGDSVFVKTGTYSLSQSTSGWACLATKADVNYLGSFAGSESNSAQRAKSDLDSNGIIEPWEFTNATTLNLTATNNAYGLFLTANTAIRVFDGFKFNGSTNFSITGTSSTYANSFIKLNGFVSFQNNIITGVTFTETITTTTTWGGTVQGGIIGAFVAQNAIMNCLIEKNTANITCSGTQTDNQMSPIAYLAAGTTTGRNVCSNSIFRNNNVALDFTNASALNTANQRGMILSMYTTNTASSLANAVKNVIIHNNTVLFTPKTGSAANTNLGNGGLLFVDNAGTVGNSDSILHCTVANNKMTRIGYGIRVGYANTSGNAHIVANNIGFNNYNYKDDGSYVIQNFVCWNTGTNAANLIASNITNGGMGLSAASGVTVNNLTDLANTNTGTKAPYFSNPTTVVGYTTDGTVETSRWNISSSSSYLISKGTTVSNKYDKANIPFASTPSVGAYEGGDVSIQANATQAIGLTTSVKSITLAPGAKLNINSGSTLTATNGITLESNSNGTATLLNSGTYSGTVTVQQYLGTARNWYVSSPVSSSNAPATNIDYYYEYVEAGNNNPTEQPGSATAYWKGLNTGTSMEVGKGYIAKASAGTTIQFTGTPNNGNITTSFDLTRDDAKGKGFNLVGNPYPSYIDWTAVANVNPNLSKTFYFRTKNNNQTSTFTFVTYNGLLNTYVSSNGTANTTITRFIPPTQAFWVRVNSGTGATKMYFNNNMRTHRDNDLNLMKAPKADSRLRVRLQLINGAESDETLICTDKNADYGFDAYDSPKMMNNSSSVPDLYTIAGDEPLVINGLNAIAENNELPLGFSLKAAAALKIKATELANLPENIRIYLRDKQENKETELTPETDYTFSTTEATANNETRFSLLFRAPGVSTDVTNSEKEQFSVFVSAQNEIVIQAKENSNYAIYNAVGQIVENGKIISNLPLTINHLNGVFVVKVNNQSAKVVIK